MKSKIVLWGTNAQDEKVLIAVSLRSKENKVDIYTFPTSVVSEDFYQQMMHEWRDGSQKLEFPEGHEHIERELSVTESLLPDELKVERSDVVQRAQTEWHFLVLAEKLHQSYEAELQELKEKVNNTNHYDQGLWDNLRGFWEKVQEQVREKNLYRGQGDRLKQHVNELFLKMKEYRKAMDAEFDQMSKDVKEKIMAALEDVEKKANEGARLPVMFEELKKLQRKFRQTRFTKEDKEEVWVKLDAVFKDIKNRSFGGRPAPAETDGNSPYLRLKHRYDGLVSAIRRMDQSIHHDREELEFQSHKIAITTGQLEAQIRQAKILMIEERVRSKDEKLTEMITTKADLEKRLKVLKIREDKQKAQAAVKEKIAENIKSAAEARDEDASILEAAEKIAEAKTPNPAKNEPAAKKEEGLFDAVTSVLGESFEDVIDTVKAVASVVGEKIGDKFEELKEEYLAEKEEANTAETAAAVAETETVAEETPTMETEEVVAQEEMAIADETGPEEAASETPVADEALPEQDDEEKV